MDMIEAWEEAKHGHLSAASEAEQGLIGATFIDNSLAVTLDLSPHEFGVLECAKLWEMAQRIVGRGDVFSVSAIAVQMPSLEDWMRACADLGAVAAAVKSTVHSYVRRIKDANARRRIEMLARGLAEQIWDQDLSADELLGAFVGQSSRLTAQHTARTKRQVIEQIVKDLERPPVVYETGIPALDRVLAGGLWPGKCIGIGARKKVGKTVLAGTISHNLNAKGHKHLYVCAEMSDTEIEQRNVARDLGINSMQFLIRNNAELPRLTADYMLRMPDATIYEHVPGVEFDHLRQICNRAKLHHGITGIVMDYLQLVEGRDRGDTEEQHHRKVAQWLANYCRQENLWGVLLCQTNQEGNARGGEGIKLACDVYFNMRREKDAVSAWLEMQDSRYLPYRHVGAGDSNGLCTVPGLILNPKGPFFEDASVVNHQGLDF